MLPGAPVFIRVLAIGAVAGLMVVGTITVVSFLRGLGDRPGHPPATVMTSPGEPIPAEALPYRTRPGNLAVDPTVTPRPQAQPRTMEIHRSLRAYPGAPPRIPHGLTDREFRETLCNSCHARGGFAPRFGTYTPVTPHPEWSDCLQCHAPDAMTVGLGLPRITDDVICRQCHVDPDLPPPSLVSLDWQPMAWPTLDQWAMEGSPHWIPHPLQNREDCLACHGGPSALQGIRTTHPERVDCRACHVTVEEALDEVFTRPMEGPGPTAGGGP
jgi:nitrate reductase (cytochrome), electron transfer subunit